MRPGSRCLHRHSSRRFVDGEKQSGFSGLPKFVIGASLGGCIAVDACRSSVSPTADLENLRQHFFECCTGCCATACTVGKTHSMGKQRPYAAVSWVQRLLALP